MHTVGLEDELRIRLIPSPGTIRLRCDVETLAVDQTNLVYRAASAILDRAGRDRGLEIEITKRIPMGAGLGGGSSDAAATILGLNALLELGWSRPEMESVGQPLGSDVPFFLHAPAAVVTGRGETVRPIFLGEVRWLVLVNPGFPVETRWAYHELSTTRRGIPSLSRQHMEIDSSPEVNWPALIALAENDFEAVIFAKYPLLQEIKQALLAKGAEVALLSGSGATIFGVFRNEADARVAHDHFGENPRLKTFLVPTCSGPLIVRKDLAGARAHRLTRSP
jgi:4-diphosphocytidyl-2-C-methyl-D-erythritol kinase